MIKVILLAIAMSMPLQAHVGGIDKDGGHNCGKASVEKGLCSGYHSHKGEESGYDRSDWPHWLDTNHDCLNTRAEVLIRDSIIGVGLSGCTVITGVWWGPFSGEFYTKASDVDIDHIVPLVWAHKHGGDGWSRHQKKVFANDFSNLLTVDDGLNQAKGGKGPYEWMPPNKWWRCTYINLFNTIVFKYGLVYTKLEARAMAYLEANCNIK